MITCILSVWPQLFHCWQMHLSKVKISHKPVLLPKAFVLSVLSSLIYPWIEEDLAQHMPATKCEVTVKNSHSSTLKTPFQAEYQDENSQSWLQTPEKELTHRRSRNRALGSSPYYFFSDVSLAIHLTSTRSTLSHPQTQAWGFASYSAVWRFEISNLHPCWTTAQKLPCTFSSLGHFKLPEFYSQSTSLTIKQEKKKAIKEINSWLFCNIRSICPRIYKTNCIFTDVSLINDQFRKLNVFSSGSLGDTH